MGWGTGSVRMGTAVQITDDGGVDLREFGVVHQEPRFPRPADDRSLDGGLLGIWGSEAGIQRHAVGPMNALVKLYCWMAVSAAAPMMAVGLGPQQPAGQEHPAAFWASRRAWATPLVT